MGTANGEQPAAAVSSDKLRHVESMSQLPSGAGKISGINAVVLGESLAAEENDLVFPSPEFSADALVSSPKQVCRA
jgi:acetyl-CoA synthetase